jgi:3-hydroxyisobutyrate dehydrogenase-like beta-hydroxyacid dehydrogenase
MTNGLSAPNSLPNVTYGFIGIGVMGWGMAQNLRAKIPESSTLVICELVEARRDKFVAETKGKITVAHSPREVAEQAVSYQVLVLIRL